jgi:UDP-glucose 4-epimerase
MSKTMCWAITGAAGFLGSHVVEQLLSRGESVVAIDNFSSGRREFLEPFLTYSQFKLAELDIREGETLTACLNQYQPQIVVHLAALHFIPAAVAQPDFAVSLNVHGTQSVLLAARKVGVKRFWFASTGDVYAPSASAHREDSQTEPFNIYGLTKAMGEQLIHLEAKHQPETAFVIGRLFNLYGVRETNPHIIPEVLQQLQQNPTAPLYLGNLFPRRDMVPVEEAARAVIESVLHAPIGVTTVNVATGIAWSMQDLLNMIGEVRKQSIEIQIDPNKVRPVEREHLQADVTKLENLLGWVPHGNLRQGIQQLLVQEGMI